MKLETFFEKFDQFADAPNTIPAMRELVLQLAVRGNLTEQANGEISEPQLSLADAFRVRRGKRGQSDAEDIPFPIPKNWGWVAVGDSMDMINGRAFKPEEWSAEGTPIIRIQNLNNENAPFNRCKADLDPKIHVNDGDFLISWSGTPGTSFGAFIWTRGFAYLNQHIFRCELVEGVFMKEFLRLAINARLDEMISHAQGAVGLRHITKGKLENIRLPLPPLAEQKRIVAKVDELLALCDRLEAQQQERDIRRAALARASLARFADAPTPANLNFLFHKSYDISPADLRKSILTLAVQGKLVPQDPNDEPAVVLMGKIAGAIKVQVDGGSVRAMKPLTTVTENEKTFLLPAGWVWARLQEVIDVRDGTHDSPKDSTDPDAFPLVTSRNFENGDINFETTRRISAKDHFEIQKRSKVDKHDILFSMIGGNIGNQVIVKTDAQFSVKNVALFKYYDRSLTYPLFIKRYMEHLAIRLQQESVGGAQPFVSLGYFRKLPIALPPTTEQRRIVTKVDQLMTLVDELETQLAASRATAKNLLEALVAELTAAGAPSRREDA